MAHRNADTVQATGNLVAALITAKFSAGVEHRQDCLERALLRARVYVAWDTSPVVPNSTATVFFQCDIDLPRGRSTGWLTGYGNATVEMKDKEENILTKWAERLLDGTKTRF